MIRTVDYTVAQFTGLSGEGSVSVFNSYSGYWTISGAGNTGNYYPNSNPSGYISSGQTGDFYPRFSNPSGYITASSAITGLVSGSNVILTNNTNGTWTITATTGGEGGAPSSASFVSWQNDANLSADRIISGRSGIALVNDGNYLYVDYTGAIASSSAASYLSFDNFGNSGTGVLDDNFDGSSINAKWSGMGTGLLTNINQNYGAINMYENSTSSVRARALVQALPTSSTGNFFITKVSPSLNFAYAYDGGGIVFYNSGTSKYYLGGGIIHSSTNFQGYSAYFATTGATSATNETIGGGFTYPQSPFYIKAGMSGANFVVGYSLNGSSFRLFDSSSAATTIANMGTPTHVGIMFHRLRNSASNDKSAWSFDFFKETTDSTFY